MNKIGSEITNLSQCKYTTGIQRVMVETHKHLSNILLEDEILLGVSSEPELYSNNYRKNSYLATDPTLRGNLAALSEIDTLICLDANLILSYKNIFREREKRELKVISVIHDLIPFQFPDFFDKGEKSRLVFWRYLQAAAALSDVLLFDTEAVKSEFLKMPISFQGQLKSIHLGNSFYEEKLQKKQNPKISLMYVSTIEPRKNHCLVLEAFDLLINDGYDAFLTIVGAYGWNSQSTKDEILNHRLFGSRLIWKHNCDEEELIDTYRSNTISIYASKVEGFGLSIEEGLHFGHKVLVNDIPVFKERHQANLYFYDGTSLGLYNQILNVSRQGVSSLAGNKIRSMKDYAIDLLDVIRSLNGK